MDETLIVKAKEQSKLCRIFSNPCRLLILWSLAEGELSVNEIADQVGSTLQNVSQHLSLMKKRKIIASRRQGRHIYYRIVPFKGMEGCLAVKPPINTQFENEILPQTMEVLNDHS